MLRLGRRAVAARALSVLSSLRRRAMAAWALSEHGRERGLQHGGPARGATSPIKELLYPR